MHVQVLVCVQGMEEEMVLGGKADMGSLPGVGISIIKPERAKNSAYSLNVISAMGLRSWWDIMLLLLAEAKSKT